LNWLLLFLTGCVNADAPVHPEDTEVFVFEVPGGSSASGLTGKLAENGLISSELKWKMFLRTADGSCLKAGRFEVSRSNSMRETLDTLCGVPLANDVPFTVVEGWRIREIDAALAAKGWIEPGAYATLAKSKAVDLPFAIETDTLEGYLFPDTYMVSPDHFEAKAFIERQLGMFQSRFLDGAELGDRSLSDVVIMASMLEREEPNPTNRPLVAGILWKRLDSGWKLGVDATSRYTLDDWNDRRAFLKQLRDPDDVYNTRLRQGLPPTAIGSPSIDALRSAAAPEASEWWYYLHDANGGFHPARDGAGHEKNRRTWNVY